MNHVSPGDDYLFHEAVVRWDRTNAFFHTKIISSSLTVIALPAWQHGFHGDLIAYRYKKRLVVRVKLNASVIAEYK